MRILRKIVLFPLTLLIDIVLHFGMFLITFGGGLLGVIAYFLFALVICLCITTMWANAFALLVIAYLISPWGIPMVGIWCFVRLQALNDWLKGK